MTLAIRAAARTDVGLARDGNEDSALASGRLLVIADGMGGHAAGEVASAVTVRAMAELGADEGTDPLQALGAAVDAANERIRAAVEGRPERAGMGTTLTALLWTGDDLALAHVGDSRGYLLRDGELRQVTHDHTYVQALVDEGRISAEDAVHHPARSLLVRALGGQPDAEPDLQMLHVRAGDRLLLCSDGLSDVVRDDAIRDALAAAADAGTAADDLVALALAGGGPDNVTVIVVDVTDEAGAAPSDGQPTEEVVLGAAVASATEDDPSSTGEIEPVVVDDEELRYAPRPAHPHRWVRRSALATLVVGIAVIALVGAYRWSQQQYFVGSDSGQVAIFRGLSQEVGGASVNSVEEIPGGLPVAALPEVYQDQVAGTISAADLDDAHAVVDRLREAACQAAVPRRPVVPRKPTPGKPTPAATPRATSVPRATAAPAPTPAAPAPAPGTASRSPTATPSPTPVLPEGLDCTGTSVVAP